MSLIKKKKAEEPMDLDSVMKKYDRESNVRIWEGKPRIAVNVILAIFSLFCLYVTLFASWLEELRLTCGIRMWGHCGGIPGFSAYAFSTPDGREQVSLALNLFVVGRRSVPLIYTAAVAVNRAVCGEPYPRPGE